MGIPASNQWLDAYLPSKPTLPDLGSGHLIGTTVMGTNDRTSVVDPYCLAHEHPNLLILGSSVFPTSAVANPTLTIAALVLRSVRHVLNNKNSFFG
jgi:choline dehydrogenase-like flavoprotein